MGPVGQSKLERLVHLFTSNYRNRTISATTAPAFFIFLQGRRGRGRRGWRRGERAREKNKALTAFPYNGERLSHPLSSATVCRLSVQYNRRQRGRGRVSCIVSPLILMLHECANLREASNGKQGNVFSPLAPLIRSVDNHPDIKRIISSPMPRGLSLRPGRKRCPSLQSKQKEEIVDVED